MKHIRNLIFVTLILALLGVPLAFNATPASADPIYTCLPSCEEIDGRFLAIAGVGLSTLVGMEINIEIAAFAGTTSIEAGIFDGETGDHWDIGTEPLEYTLFADPMGDGSGTVQIDQWSGASMPDNDWFSFIITTGPEAVSPSGNYFYRLRIRTLNPINPFANRFKVRADSVVSLHPVPFSYIAAANNMDDWMTIYPNYPDLSVTTYDGNFDFHIYIPSAQSSLVIWDGDSDFGSADLVDNDTDDPDTPNDVLPPFATLGTALEGVAIGWNGSTGKPQDDSAWEILRRSPSVYYEVGPLGVFGDFINNDPSGNVEWERFSIETDRSKPADIYVNEPLPPGLYHIHMEGMDLNNMNAWRFPYKVLGVCEYDPETGETNPCKELPFPFKIGDTVFKDLNMDGVQDDNEPGRPDVVVYLLDGNGFPLLDGENNPVFRVTDIDGKYSFDVEGYTTDPYTGEVVNDGVYTVKVGEENFEAGESLEGFASTTGGETQTYTVIDSNVLDYDFGYMRNVPVFGVGDLGFWKQNPDAWPVEEITVGGVTYTKDEAIQLLGFRTKNDMTYRLYQQLVPAMLNVMIGNESSCIEADIQTADQWLVVHPLGSRVGYRSAAWQEIYPTAMRLWEYNMGRLCAPAMQ